MLTVWIILIIALIIAIVKAHRDTTKYSFTILEYIVNMLMALFIGLITGLFMGVLISVILPADMEMKLKETKTIATLQDTHNSGGEFFLGCGQINGGMKYVYYYKNNDSYKMDILEYEDVSIKYTDSIPRVEFYGEVFTDAFINNFAIDLPNTYSIIYVPEGTIRNNYNLDAQ